jgi:hypothetical protein
VALVAADAFLAELREIGMGQHCPGATRRLKQRRWDRQHPTNTTKPAMRGRPGATMAALELRLGRRASRRTNRRRGQAEGVAHHASAACREGEVSEDQASSRVVTAHATLTPIETGNRRARRDCASVDCGIC